MTGLDVGPAGVVAPLPQPLHPTGHQTVKLNLIQTDSAATDQNQEEEEEEEEEG